MHHAVLFPLQLTDSAFRFANYYGDHMVLQRAPHSANVWGVVADCDDVTVEFNGKMYTATMIQGDAARQ